MKIGVLSKSNGGVDYHRLLRPFALMQDKHEVQRWTGIGEDIYDAGLDAVVFNRWIPIISQKEFIKELKSRGVRVICDVDDYWVLPRYHVAHKVNKLARPNMIEAMMLADEVWTTHEKLGNIIGDLNPNWHVIPNALDPNEEQWKPKREYGTRIGWAGGVTHFHDLMKTKDAWGDVVPVICGFQKEKEWQRLADKFRGDYIEGLDVENYGLLYEQFDIAIAPLGRDLFNQCKSNLKILEAGMKGLPIFVENVHPYTDEQEGVIKVDNWNLAISEAWAYDKEEVKRRGLSLRSYVLANYDLNKVNQKRLERL